MHECEICGASVRELRRGRCWGCYGRWVDSRPVGLGASCRFCGERRRAHLKSMELLGSWVPTCHNCGVRIGELSPLPRSLAGIRELLSRERRGLPRRFGKPDGRVFPYERRGGERRTPRLGGDRVAGFGPPEARLADPIDEDMIVEIAELASDLEALAAGLPIEGGAGDSVAGELTRIREAPLGR